MFCSSCGATLANDAKFCPQCGGLVVAAPPAGVVPAAPPQPGTTNTFAIVSLVCGFLSLMFPAAIVAIVMGHISRAQIRKGGNVQKGAGMALAGLIMGYLGVCVIPLLIIAAIAIPNLLRARIAANEASAVASIRTVNTAETTYASQYPDVGYACDLARLGPAGGSRSSNAAGLIDGTLASGRKSGYEISIACSNDENGRPQYWVTAAPAAPGQSGRRTFCSGTDHVIRYLSSGGAGDCTSSGEPLD